MTSIHGLLVIDKPPGITSRDAVDVAAKWFPRKTKIGHAGTLDPLATGVLVLALGQATRLIEYVQAMPKVYRTRITFGATSDTDDADGTITPTASVSAVEDSAVRIALSKFDGEVEQVPPAYSAAHVAGRRAHSLARRGETVSLSPRRVRINRIEVLAYSWPELELDVHCGKGTYIRSIARDLGAALGVGGYVQALRRLSIGPFTVEAAVSLEEGMEKARARVLPLTAALPELSRGDVTPMEAQRVRSGQSVPMEGDGERAIFDEMGNLVAIGCIVDGLFAPAKVFA